MQLPFQAYISYLEKESNFDPSAGYGWYDRLFGRLMFDRLRANKNAAIRICFEQHDNRVEHRRKEIEGIVERLVRKIRSRDGVEFAVIPKVSSAGKEELCLVVADYIAAIFKDHAENGIGKPSSWQARNFERIRSKVRVIHNYTTDEFFTRKCLFPG
jgi:histone H3/H4